MLQAIALYVHILEKLRIQTALLIVQKLFLLMLEIHPFESRGPFCDDTGCPRKVSFGSLIMN